MLYIVYMWLTLIAIGLLVSLWIIVMKQNSDIKSLKTQMHFLLSKIYAESNTGNEENIKEDSVQKVNPQSPEHNTYTPPLSQPLINQTMVDNGVSRELKGNMESWFGRNVIGIMASVLIFIGLVFLGILAYEYIPDVGKIIVMYLISSVVLVLGLVLSVRKRSNFSLILTGCGCGSFFISILLTHVYFKKINDIAAFSLILIWLVGTLLLSKRFSSTLLSVVAHIGVTISICFAFSQEFSEEKLAILLIYQGATIAIIILGNIFCYKQTYNFGLFVSFILTIIASAFVLNSLKFGYITHRIITNLSAAVVGGIFAAQFLCGSFISYLISMDTSKLKNSNRQIILHFANKILWVILLCISVYRATYKLSFGVQEIGPTFYSLIDARYFLRGTFITVLTTIIVIVIHGIITLVLGKKYGFDSKLETISVLLLSGVSLFLLLILWDTNILYMTYPYPVSIPCITWFIVISVLLMLAGYVTRNKAYLIGASVVLALDASFMYVSGFGILNNVGLIFVPIVYMVLTVFLIWYLWFMQSKEDRVVLSKLARLLAFFNVELSLISIFLTTNLEYKVEVLFLSLVIIKTILYLVRFDREPKGTSVMRWSFFANEVVLISIIAGFLSFYSKDKTSTLYYMLIAAFLFGLAAIRIRRVLDDGNNGVESIWAGIMITILPLAVIHGNTGLFEQAYIFSVVCMLTALACIILGFIGRVKTLRFYGLAITILSILKLVTFDVTNLNTPLRVITFIGGGIICFIISAIYSYATKKFAFIEGNDED